MKNLFVLLAFFMGLTGLKAQQAVSILPFKMHGEHIFVQISINGSAPLDFIFDSGSATFINQSSALKMRLRAGKDTLTFGSVKLAQPHIRLTDLTEYELKFGCTIDGIVGHDLFSRYVVTVNHAQQTISLYQPATFTYNGQAKAQKFKLIGNIPAIKCNLASTALQGERQNFEGMFLVNCGTGFAFVLTSPFVNRNNLLKKVGATCKETFIAGADATVAESYFGRLSYLNFGGYEFGDAIGVLSQAGNHDFLASSKFQGIIGNPILRRFTITYDYSRKTLYIEPIRQELTKPFTENCSGLELRLSENKQNIVVKNVYENSPASENGLQTGDQIVSINDRDVAQMGIENTREILKQAGANIKLGYKRGAELKTVNLFLRRLI